MAWWITRDTSGEVKLQEAVGKAVAHCASKDLADIWDTLSSC